jgi:hypothetical protein
MNQYLNWEVKKKIADYCLKKNAEKKNWMEHLYWVDFEVVLFRCSIAGQAN